MTERTGSTSMTFDVDLPDEISDETAAVILDALYALGDAFGNHYYGQIRRYFEDLRQPPPPQENDSQLSLFPEFDIPF